MVSRCTVAKQKLVMLFAVLANAGLETMAYYEQDNVLGLLLARGYLIEVAKDYAVSDPWRLAETLRAYLPRTVVARDYDPTRVPEVSPRTVAWWQFIRWLRQERALEVQQCQ
jgi:hypothetical protein